MTESAENQQASGNTSSDQTHEPATYRVIKPAPKPKLYTQKKPQQQQLPSFFFGALPMEHETTLFILVSVLDIVMTWYLISHSSQVVEANPVAAFFLYRWGGKGLVGFKMFMVAVVCVLAQIIERYKPSLGLRVLQLGTAIVAIVVIYSFTLALRMVH